MASIFTRIINGEIPSFKVAETADYYAFLDIRPLVKGHVLAVPKMEVDYIFDLPDEVISGLMTFAKKVAKAMPAIGSENLITDHIDADREEYQSDEEQT